MQIYDGRIPKIWVTDVNNLSFSTVYREKVSKSQINDDETEESRSSHICDGGRERDIVCGTWKIFTSGSTQKLTRGNCSYKRERIT